ncbi:LacI family DNA-binding transcriptional regulator [Paenibacillus allorhizosphaerae]|uniref:HTH-type transcriptional repressor ExuR n=1 Tax=Paenibacillus allorhizosphaerae TaxID=2849866 RepID=A0ABM8VB06_9BACL|nr:LacI family DNA-binding transcriptional regulator [Paenibacillus allorhizosphaerae]CAG7617989.1 putative HTH-type transcriptional repressor ExuR [Paenibacillus allorhizosphaerae]
MPTLQDIANIAGVSKATVSLALSDHPRISLETKHKIRHIAKEIGYAAGQPGNAAEAKTSSIGVVYVSDNQDYEHGFFRDTVMGICREASRYNYNVVMIGIHKLYQGNIVEDVADKVVKSGVEGIVVVSSIPNLQGFEKLIAMRFPMVFIGSRKVAGLTDPIHSVASDNYNGGRTAAEYLLELGHSNVAVVHGLHSPPWERERISGFYSALRSAGFQADEDQAIEVSNLLHPEAPCWSQLKQQSPTAVFATNVHVGMLMLHYLRECGFRIPDDASLIVFDDSPSFPMENPPITVVRQDMKSLGVLSAKRLFDLLESSDPLPNQILISAQLIERSSCAPLSNRKSEPE